MRSRRPSRMVEQLNCRRNWKICSTVKTEATARMLLPFQQHSCGLQLRFEDAAENEMDRTRPQHQHCSMLRHAIDPHMCYGVSTAKTILIIFLFYFLYNYTKPPRRWVCLAWSNQDHL